VISIRMSTRVGVCRAGEGLTNCQPNCRQFCSPCLFTKLICASLQMWLPPTNDPLGGPYTCSGPHQTARLVDQRNNPSSRNHSPNVRRCLRVRSRQPCFFGVPLSWPQSLTPHVASHSCYDVVGLGISFSYIEFTFNESAGG